jgi:pre-mRNA-processing factor 6
VETPAKARQVLNRARKAIPTSHDIWIAAGRLQEQEGNDDQVDAIISKGVETLRKNGVELPRDDWIREAEKCEENGSVATCQAIIKATIDQDVDEESRLDTWMSDAESSLARNRVETARAVYAYALRVMPQRQILWRRAADLEKSHGSR